MERLSAGRHIPFIACLIGFSLASAVAHAQDPLPSWNDGPAKQAIIDFVQTTTDKASPRGFT